MVGRGGFIALFTMLALFLYGSVAFQREMSLPELIAQGPQGLTYLGAKLAAEPWASLPMLALMCSAVASLQSSVIPTARGLLAMGRDRTMGRVWTRVSPRYGSPAVGTVLVMAIAAVVALLALAIPKLNEMILAAVNSIGLIVALYYGLTALACAARFRSDLRTVPQAGDAVGDRARRLRARAARHRRLSRTLVPDHDRPLRSQPGQRLVHAGRTRRRDRLRSRDGGPGEVRAALGLFHAGVGHGTGAAPSADAAEATRTATCDTCDTCDTGDHPTQAATT